MLLGTSNTSAGKARAVAGALLAAVLIAAGCDAHPDASQPESPEAEPLAQVTGVNIPDPNGTYFAEVVANGTGCPAGTWNTRIAPDGQVFTTTFSSYVANVQPGTTIMSKDCILSIKFHTPEGRSFSVQRFSYTGFALLNPGVIGTQTANYWFQGRPVAAPDSNRKDLVGPYNDTYVFTDDIKLDDRVWSPCGVTRDLNINTRITLQNTVNRSGYLNLSSVDGSTGKVEVVIQSRQCSIGAPDDSSTSDETTKPVDTALPKPSGVRVTPSSVRQDQPFRIVWNQDDDAPEGTTYAVELHEHYDFGYALLWRSAELTSSTTVYNGPALAKPGAYHVVVIAKNGNRTVSSDRVLLTVTPSTSDATPDAGTPAKPDAGPPAKPDAGPIAAPDAGPVVSPNSKLASWARPLVGRYAVHTDAFAVNANGGVLAGLQLALVDFVETSEGGLDMILQSCLEDTTLSTVTHSMRTPEASPPQRRKVVLEPGERWSTDGSPLAIGFLRDGAPQCAGRRAGEYVAKSPAQVWNRSATCRCGVAGEVPRLDDCRVTDPDRDGQPGLAYDWTGPSAVNGKVSHAVSVTRARFVGGRVSAEGQHLAQYVNDGVGYELVCENGACDGTGTLRPCTSDYNPAQFVPARGLTCADLRARQRTLFRQTAVPRTCTRGTMTNAP